jgi:hypothetical protein
MNWLFRIQTDPPSGCNHGQMFSGWYLRLSCVMLLVSSSLFVVENDHL